jgi:hypothetical protein
VNLHTWLRQTYRVEEPVRRPDRVRMVVAYDKDSGREVDRWLEGGRPHIHVWTRFLEENEDMAELVVKERHHRKQHFPLEVRLR